MRATGIVRRIDDLGRVVIPKEIRRTMRIREGDPLQMTLTKADFFILGMVNLAKRQGFDLFNMNKSR
ncbi:MAG: AbrB/MazE/SpoVT family DNA-binding domain-containing protein [Clostridia bacterium]|nr:AbrB/MazE/SpoVT family DNA-binding domain-containing protein [Clostridia bacterium]